MQLRNVKQSTIKDVLFKTQVSLCLLTLVQFAQANPTGGQVAQGSATISSGQHTVINQTTNSAVINWQDFSIGEGEHTQFVVPNANSATLNRVTGGNTSAILGKLSSNGKVYLINPNGILFGAKAQVNVGSLIASTSNMSDQNFMSGHYVFDQPGVAGAQIINYGNISTVADHGLVVLVAPSVINEGVIQANLGKIGMGAGERWTLDLYGDNLITFSVSADAQQTLYRVDQKGTVSANGGTVLLTAQAADDILESVINMDGYIEAKTVSEMAGQVIVLGNENSRVNMAGTIDVTGSLGGKISITGTYVDVGSSAHLNASGVFGGGTVLVGGGYQGSGLLPHAMTTVIHEYAKIEANALEQGNGGEVVVWSDDHTIFNGEIYAQGGALGGNGGSVETSSKHMLTIGPGIVDTSAALGKAGIWLLDPDFVLINAVSAAAINAGLLLNDTVAVLADIDLYVDGGFTFTWDNDSTLTLAANNNIVFAPGSSIVNTSAGTLNLRADADADGTGTVSFGAGSGVDFSGSTGAVNLFYNPTDYTTPTDYSSYVQADAGKFNAYMLVNNLANLQAIQTNLDGDYALGADIAAAATFVMNGGLGFDPIGDLDNPFTGSMQFAGYVISNLVINRPTEDYVGLFGVTQDAIFHNVNIVDSSVVGKNFTGIFAGQFLRGETNGPTFIRGNSVGNDFTGIIFGSTQEIDITGNLVALGNVVGHDYVGGIAGSAINNIIIGNIFHVGNTTGNNNVGGLVGTLSRNASIVGLVFNDGDVTGLSNVGGIAGSVSGIDFDANGTVDVGGISGTVTSSEGAGGVIGQLNTNLGSNADALFAEHFGSQGIGGLQRFVGRELAYNNLNNQNAVNQAFSSPTYVIDLDTNLYRQLGGTDGFGVNRGVNSISAKLTSTDATGIFASIVATDLIGGIFNNAFDEKGNFKISHMTDSFVSNIASAMSASNERLSATGVMAMGAGVGGLLLSSRGGMINNAFGQSMGANLLALFGMVSMSNGAESGAAVASTNDPVALKAMAEATSSAWCGVTCRLVMLSVQSPTKMPSFSDEMGVNTSTYVKSGIRPNSAQEQRYTWDDSANRYVRSETLNEDYGVGNTIIKITSPL